MAPHHARGFEQLEVRRRQSFEAGFDHRQGSIGHRGANLVERHHALPPAVDLPQPATEFEFVEGTDEEERIAAGLFAEGDGDGGREGVPREPCGAGRVVPFEIEHAAGPQARDLKPLETFLDSYPRKAKHGIRVSMHPRVERISRRIYNLPLALLLRGPG